MTDRVYDLVIIGAGPAGITAAVYAARKKLDCIVLTKDIGGQTALSGDIENYTGYQFISGPDLTAKFEEHMRSFDIEAKMPYEVADIRRRDNRIEIQAAGNVYFAKTAIIATGKRPRPLNVKGEDVFKNKGVTYCATCDGPLFKGKPVAVVGGGNSGLDAALSLMRMTPKVYLITNAGSLTGDPVMQEKVGESGVVEIITGAEIQEIYGDAFVKGIKILKEGILRDIAVEGVFVEIGLIPNSECARDVRKNRQNEIAVDSRNRTNIDGIFSAGDVTDVPEKQIIIACGEGSKACLSAFRYISTRSF